MPKQIRADLHERYAAWLEEVADDRLPELEEVLGYHLEQAYRYRLEVLRADDHGRAVALRAGTRLASAGRRALAKGDVPAAVNLLDRAAALLPERCEHATGATRRARHRARASRASSPARSACSRRRSTGAARDGDRSVELAAEIERLSLLLLSDPAETDRLLEELEARHRRARGARRRPDARPCLDADGD